MIRIDINDYDYDLPENRIAQNPVNERDASKLLIYRNELLNHDTFRNIWSYLPKHSLLVFNNTRVIRARIKFTKVSGASIEILCLEPLTPADYEISFSSTKPVEWKCLVGNLKKWKGGTISVPFKSKGEKYELRAEKIKAEGEAWRILFSWTCSGLSFGEVLERVGHIPLPPYINREDAPEDASRYQTVYSIINGSVAAPTAGLHFTDIVLEKLKENEIKSTFITLHVGAGTFKPVKSKNISDHEMHCEHFTVTQRTIEQLLEYQGNVIPVGTTSVRTLESLFWLGVKLMNDLSADPAGLTLTQWEAYSLNHDITAADAMRSILNFLKKNCRSSVEASTSMMIVPGYKFRIINGMITNFHQPRSTLLLLVSAWAGNDWKKIYNYALQNNFRFLSYGDCSLLI